MIETLDGSDKRMRMTDGGTAPAVFVFVALPSCSQNVSEVLNAGFIRACNARRSSNVYVTARRVFFVGLRILCNHHSYEDQNAFICGIKIINQRHRASSRTI